MAAEIVPLPVPPPPHSIEAEQAVLGALLIDGAKVWPIIAPILTARDFYRPDHRLIFENIAELCEGPGAPDVVSLFAHLDRNKRAEEAGGFAYISRLVRETSTAVNAEQYANVVRERAQLRALADMAREIEAAAISRGNSASEIAADLERRLSVLRGRARTGAGPVSSEVLAAALIDDMERRREGATGLMTGLADFDEITGGLEAGELTIIAGRPGLGKTALLVTIAAHASRDDPIAVFSAEMPALQLARRCTALLGGISQTKLRHPKGLDDSDWAHISEGTTRLSARKLWIDDRQMPPLSHIRAECIGHKARAGLSLVMIDYCQLVEGRGANRYEQLRDVAYGAKALAKELSVPIVLLAQINRGVESRNDKRPMLSDLRDSGAIEEAADIVGMLYREGYYDDRFDLPNVVECMIEKHRNGERGQCLWHFAGEFSRMTALDEGARRLYRSLISDRMKRKGGDA